jgi:hypothetical protein
VPARRGGVPDSLLLLAWLVRQGLVVLTRTVLYQLLILAASSVMAARRTTPTEMAAHQVRPPPVRSRGGIPSLSVVVTRGVICRRVVVRQVSFPCELFSAASTGQGLI